MHLVSTNSNACVNESECYQVTGLAVAETLVDGDIKLYPMPFIDVFYFETEAEGNLEIYDLSGKLIVSSPKNSTV
jgi:hypothetical protein